MNNYDDMSDFEINLAVGERVGLSSDNGYGFIDTDGNAVLWVVLECGTCVERRVNYCGNPADAWPIIKRLISSGHFISFNGDSVICDDWHQYHNEGEELRALMVVYLKLKSEQNDG